MNSPVIEVVVKVSVTNAELELLEVLIILHNVQGVEHIVSLVFGKDEQVFLQVCEIVRAQEVVVGVCDMQSGVIYVSKHLGRK